MLSGERSQPISTIEVPFLLSEKQARERSQRASENRQGELTAKDAGKRRMLAGEPRL